VRYAAKTIKGEASISGHESYILDSLDYIFVADSTGLTWRTVTYLVAEATAFSETAQSNNHYVIKGHQFWYQWKSHIQLPIGE